MNRQDQIGLLKRLLHYVETKTTCLADAPWRNDVSVYADPEHLAREQQILDPLVGSMRLALVTKRGGEAVGRTRSVGS